MSGGEKSARIDSFAFGVKGFRGALLAGTALVAAPALLALSLGAAQAGDLINDGGTRVIHGKRAVDDVINENGGRLINKGLVEADDVTNKRGGVLVNKGTLAADDVTNTTGGRLINKGLVEADDVTNKKGGVLVNKGTLTADDLTNKSGGRFINKGLVEADRVTNKRGGVLVNKGTLTADDLTDKSGGRIVNEGTLTADDITNKSGGRIVNERILTADDVTNESGGRIVNDGWLRTDDLTNKAGGLIVNKRILTADDITNASGGRIVNDGRLTAQDISNGGRIVNKDNLIADDITNKSGGRIINDGSLRAGDLTNSGRIVNEGKLTADELTNRSGGRIVNDGRLRAGDLTNSGRILNEGKLTADELTNKSGGRIVNDGRLRAGDLTNKGRIVNEGKLTVDDTLTNKSGGRIVNDGRLRAGDLTNSGRMLNEGKLTADELTNRSGGRIVNDGRLRAGDVTNDGRILNNGKLTADDVTNNGRIVNNGIITDTLTNSGVVINNGIYNADVNNTGATALIANSATGTWNGNLLSNTGGAQVGNAGAWNGDANNASLVVNSGTWTTTSAGFTNSGTLVTTGTLDATNGGLANTKTGMVGAAGTIKGAITNAGTFEVIGPLVGNSTFANNSGGALLVGANSFTGITTLTNASGGAIFLDGGTIGDMTTNNSGLVVATGVSTISGTFNNLAGGVIDLTQGATPTTNQLKTGAFKGTAGSAVDVRFDFSTVAGAAGLVTANGTSGTTTVNYFNVTPGTQVVLGNAVTVIKDTTGSGSLNPTGITEAFGLVNVSVQSDGHGGAELVRSLNVGGTTAPVASVMAALEAIDTSFHQSTAPFVASPQSQDPDKWTGGVWSRATAGQTTTKSTAFESFGGTSTDLRVKTNFDAYEVGVDTGILNFGGSGWNGHFGVMAGAVTATANELLSASGTSVKFDVPFAGVYGVMTHGPFFMDLEYRHDWVDTQVTNVPANLNNADLKGHGDSFSGSAGYHFDLVNNWFVEPAAGFGLTQTQFDALATNLGQQAQGIAPGAISFDSIFSMLVHGGARVGTTFVVGDTLALQPFGTLSVWRELGGQSNATFADGGVSDPLTLSRIGTFYQAGIGLSAQLLNTGFIGFARGDFRWGDNLNGAAVVGGLRYTFAP